MHGQTLANRMKPGRVFNIRSGHLHADACLASFVKLPNLQLKTWPKQLLGYLPLDIALPGLLNELCMKATVDKMIGL